MNRDTGFWTILICVIIMFTAFIFGDMHATNRIQKEAIKANVAKYQIDEKTGETKFIFLTPAEKETK
jgi:hypothetical protein